MGDLRPAQASDIHPQAAPGPPEAQLPWDEPATRLLSAAVGGSQGEHGDSAEGGEGVSGADCHPRGAGGPCEISPRVPRGGGGAPDLGAVPWAGERPGRQKGGLGDARHGAPLALKIGRACVRRPQPFLWLERPFVMPGRSTGGRSRDSSQHVRTDTDSVPLLPAEAPTGARGKLSAPFRRSLCLCSQMPAAADHAPQIQGSSSGSSGVISKG